MDPAQRQRLVERVWLLEQLRAEAKARADRATTEARLVRQSAAEAGREAADLHERVAGLGEELAHLHDQLGDQPRAAQESSEARAEHREAAVERDRGHPPRGDRWGPPGARRRTWTPSARAAVGGSKTVSLQVFYGRGWVRVVGRGPH